MTTTEQGHTSGLDTPQSIVIAGKVATDPRLLATPDKRPTVRLYLESEIPEERKSLRYLIFFRGRSSHYVLNAVREGQQVTVHGSLHTGSVILDMRSYPVQFIEASRLEVDDEAISIRVRPFTKPWFVLKMPQPELPPLNLALVKSGNIWQDLANYGNLRV